MNWIKKWQALAARISGTIEAGKYIASIYSLQSDDTGGILRHTIVPELKKIKEELENLVKDSSAPKQVIAPLQKLISSNWVPSSHTPLAVLQSITRLLTLHSEVEYLLKDTEIEGCNRTERAFEQLKRLIEVNKQEKALWIEAFQKNEPQCEKLGAVHLLAHGIWAFKCNAMHAGTDLVYNERPLESEELEIRGTASTLVLTEWKVVNQDNYLKEAEKARKQAMIYKGGILTDLELKRTRYIVLVSEKHIAPITNISESDVIYRHINIPLNPDVPSQQAKKNSTKKRKVSDKE